MADSGCGVLLLVLAKTGHMSQKALILKVSPCTVYLKERFQLACLWDSWERDYCWSSFIFIHVIKVKTLSRAQASYMLPDGTMAEAVMAIYHIHSDLSLTNNIS